jgi:transposase
MLKSQVEKVMAINPKIMIVGIDIAKKTHCARVLNFVGLEITKPFSFHNTKEDFIRTVVKLENLKKEKGLEEIIVGMEPTGHYWKGLAWFLKQNGIPVVMVNPYHVKKTKELDDNTQTKSDRKDAFVIAKLVKDGRYSKVYLPEGVYAELRVLSNTRIQLRAKLNAVKNMLIAILDEYFPEFVKVFKNLEGKLATCALYHFPFPQQVIELGVDGMFFEFKKAVKKGACLKRAKKLFDVAKESIGVTAGTESAKIRMRSCLNEIEFLRKQMANIEAEMEKKLEVTGIAKYMISFPGIGVVTAAGILGEIGDPKRFESWEQVRKYAGFNLVEDSSGERQGKTVISKRGRSMLRNILYQAALVMVAKNTEMKLLYHYLTDRKENPLCKKQALVVIAIKIIKVLLALVNKQQVYDAEKVLGEYRITQIKAA